ncbi:hypothetical protein ACJX0J_035961, partial [Zea mays]
KIRALLRTVECAAAHVLAHTTCSTAGMAAAGIDGGAVRIFLKLDVITRMPIEMNISNLAYFSIQIYYIKKKICFFFCAFLDYIELNKEHIFPFGCNLRAYRFETEQH